MLSKEAIQELSQVEAISAARKSITEALKERGAISLPNDFAMHDLEKYMPNRRRVIGTMNTSVIADFAEYSIKNKEEGAAVFIDPKTMSANAVLNLGTPAKPGHADNTAILNPERTAAYKALRFITENGRQLNQQDAAEFLEDWPDFTKCANDDGNVENSKAIAAIRCITIEAMRKIESEEKSLSASRTAFESVAATSKDPIPTRIEFTCNPYKDLIPRTFVLRLGILTGEAKPTIRLRIVKIEEHEEQMAAELSGLITESIKKDEMPVMIGSYSVKN